MSLKLLLTGATGMVGEGVLHEALQFPTVERVTLLGRRASGVVHPKIREIVHEDLFDLSSIEDRLSGFDACLFCLGTTSIGKDESEYRRTTHDLTMSLAETLVKKNPSMTFCYISAMGADNSLRGGGSKSRWKGDEAKGLCLPSNRPARTMWAQVKGETENDLMKLPFKAVYSFRPGFLYPTPGMKHTQKYYKYILWMYPFLRIFVSSRVSTLAELGRAMLRVAENGYPKTILEVTDIKAAAVLRR